MSERSEFPQALQVANFLDSEPLSFLRSEDSLAESPIRNEPKAKFIIVPAKLRKFCDWIRNKIYATLIYLAHKK